MNPNRTLYLLLAALALPLFSLGQDTLRNKPGSQYLFTVKKRQGAAPVVSQGQSGTCWSFSALSFFETELERMGKGSHRLSEMYVVRKAYEGKAETHVRMHGHNNFDAGGAFHDIPYVIRRHGIVPLEVYNGLNYGEEKHNHAELDAVIKGAVRAAKENPQGKLTPAWKKAVGGILDAYLGPEPKSFTHKGKTYTPRSYADALGLNMDDYVSLTSYTHHPFYMQFVLEIPDNWAFGLSYNVTLDELCETMEHALSKGYTFAWGADVSEPGFAFREGLAILPEDETLIKKKGKDSKHFNDAGAEKAGDPFSHPVKQQWVTQQQRQQWFDDHSTTDDHGMHATGLATDQNGDKYLIVKNSWGTDSNTLDGYFFASMAYARAKTMNIYLHKSAVPEGLRKKLGM